MKDPFMRLRNAMLISVLQQNATLLLLFVTGVVIAHLLTPKEVGSYAVAIAAANIFIALKDTAVGSYVISAPELDVALLRAAYGLSLAITGCVSIGCIGLSFALAAFYQDPILGQALRIVAFAQLGPAVAFPGTVRLTRAMRFGSLLTIGLGAAMVQSLTSIVIAARGHGAVGLAWGYFAWSIVTAMMTVAYEPDTVRLRPTLAGTRRLLAFGGWTSAMMVVSSTAMSAPELMIGRVSGTADVALFSRAQNLVSFIRNGLVFGIGRPLLPSLGQLEATGASVAPMYQRFVEIITGLAWPAYAVMAVWAEPLVRTIYGEAWSTTGTMMPPIAIAHALTLTVAAHYDVLIVKRRERTLFACEFASFIFTATALAVGLTFGTKAAIWSLVASGAFSAVCYFGAVRSAIDIAPNKLLQAWSRSLGLALVVIPIPMSVRVLVADQPVAIMIGFVASSAISALIWIAAAIIIRHELSFDIGAALERLSYALRLALVARISSVTKDADRGIPRSRARII
ncbi:oligosaccharide flippase family protein [Bradyrhizobium sp. CB1650]|uniref:oligosaccharide flippase family protein n=1 Tax=Bradyrhizobium sp. CB1650 TaxID=3039153 RepID=UPI0024354EDC|nr:oligosaccharide flippase family protein [Bradyrhizobium sp. CB1650]WGD54937.1 oligosaccharide flippase family protein [Bradyrhizobium sp. CB1650]